MSRWNWAELYLRAQDGHSLLFPSRQEQKTRTFDYVSWARLTSLKEYGALRCAVCDESLAQINESRDIYQIVLPCLADWSVPTSKFDAGHSKDPRPTHSLCYCGCETFPAAKGPFAGGMRVVNAKSHEHGITSNSYLGDRQLTQIHFRQRTSRGMVEEWSCL